uniref:Uncharacterized protein n=1 Tax=Manihot esculenta TaxID=3983 RepID=A0A2C9V8H4_MANES
MLLIANMEIFIMHHDIDYLINGSQTQLKKMEKERDRRRPVILYWSRLNLMSR